MRALQAWDPARSAWVDPQSGRLTREAQIWLRDLWLRTGGAVAEDSTAMFDALALRRPLVREPGPANDAQVLGAVMAYGRQVQQPVRPVEDAQALVAVRAFGAREVAQRRTDDAEAILAGQVFGG